MWNKSKQAISAGDNSINLIAGGHIYFRENVPTELIDQKIEEELEKLRKSRFFREFDTIESSLRLGRQLTDGNLSGGSDEARGRALTWCARLLSRSENLEQAEEFLERAKTFGDFAEAKIASAFIHSQKGDKVAALGTLSDIDSNISHSARLMIVEHHDGAEGALNWIHETGYAVEDLDSDGKSFLLSHQFQLGRWGEAAQTVCAISDADFDETPVLHHLVALATLLPAVPTDFRSVVLTQVPFDVRDFPLASDSVAMAARRMAHQHFLDAVEAAKKLVCPRAARVDDEYALWLELSDPAQQAHGRVRLQNKLHDLNTALGFVHYALNFGIKLDLGAVERAIERSIAINGEMTIDAAIARFALAFTQPTPEVAASYIARHHDQLSAYIDAQLIQARQIELLSRAGLIERAREVLDRLVEEGISAEQESSLRRIIAGAQEGNSIASCKAQYETTRTLSDLINLVTELENHQHWADLCKFGRRLFEETHSLVDAERLVKAFNYTHRSEELVDFLKENLDLLSLSNHLRMSYAWGLYHEGEFLKSRDLLAELGDDGGRANYRALQVNLGIATGDWPSLSAYIADELRNRADRSAQDLLGAAELALHLGLPQAKDLVFEAAAKANNDSAVLAAAYFSATSAGWEDDPQVFQWLEKAAVLSGENGPLQKMSLKDILDRKPEWDQRESETWRLLAHGQIPIFVAAQSLNRTLIDLTIFPALSNLMEADPRRRSAIPAYSGKRRQLEVDVIGKVVALDAGALLTLSLLKILDVALDTFGKVYIPHSTLSWLFTERKKATFHQPSRIADAREVRDFLATDRLKKFNPSTIASSSLTAQVGDDLAALIAEAEKMRDGDETQHIVVRPAPVHRISTLMEEEADLSAHAPLLSSCLAVVEKMRRKGVITAPDEKRARAYLQLHEKPWPNQPEIADGAILYLDDLAITYLQHLGLLGQIKAAGLTAVVSPRELSEVDAFISYERISGEVKSVIERIRASLNSRIESGHVRVGSRHNFDDSKTETIREHPSFGVLALASHCDVSIIDDRFINRHANMENAGAQMAVLSTLDLLDALVVAGVLSDDDRLEHRTRLRQAGYFFIPVDVAELEQCLNDSTVDKGSVVETAELKAIRESILRVRMSDWLQLPEEAPWLDGTLKAFVCVLKNIWVDKANIEEVTARSNWLIEQIDIRGWAHRLAPENADNVVRTERAAFILLLLTPPINVRQSVVEAYWNWVEEGILIPMQQQFPEVYAWLVDWYRNRVANAAEIRIFEEGDS